MVKMRKKDQILKEMEETQIAAGKLKESGVSDSDLQFFDGWLQALAWVLTTNNIEGDS